MTTMDEDMKWMKLTHLLSVSALNLRAPFYTSSFYFKKNKIALLDVHTSDR